MEIKGKIVKVLEKKSGVSKSTGKAWMSQQYIIDCENRDQESLMFTVFGEDRINEMAIMEGQYLTAYLSTRCQEYDGKFYNEIRAWKVELDRTRVQPNPTNW